MSDVGVALIGPAECGARRSPPRKPIADTVEAGERMRDDFAAAGLVLAVGHGMRRLGAARRVKELLDEGGLGRVVLAEANYFLRLYGTEGVLDYEVDLSVWPRAERADGATRLRLRSAEGEVALDFRHRDPLVEELEEFGRAVRGGAAPETGADEGIAALKVILDALPPSA